MYSKPSFDPVRLEIYRHLFAAVADEMGAILRKASFSPNIKERRDFSCALFDARGNMIAQAAHIPVHLGSMPLSVISAINKFNTPKIPLLPGDTIILNDPFLGGTHLPDITLVTPVFIDALNRSKGKLTKENTILKIDKGPFAYVASRAHHADVGGITPGSMPNAREIYQEGLIIPPIKIVNHGQMNQDILDLILANVRTPEERTGDLTAQIAANQRGVIRLQDIIQHYGVKEVKQYMGELLAYTERMTRQLLSNLPDGIYSFTDRMDDDGATDEEVLLKVTINIRGDEATVDFTGSAPQQPGSINAVYAITLSAVNYVFRCLIDLDVPNNSGCLVPIQVIAPEGTIVNAKHPAPVAGGNVETSQRIVDVLLGALAQACPERVPAASQGTMNNISIGGWDPDRHHFFTYYETIGGGTGASATADGASAIHSHMTNTLNTPIEALEYSYPLQIIRYEIRPGSGGKGKYQGGNGIIRDIKLLKDAQVTILSDRRTTYPYGLSGGEPGQSGKNILIRGDEEIPLPGRGSFDLHSGDIISIRTPGGGGFGKENG
jgi:N-methylhydantoinase B